jgi:hypothetical protein
MSGELLLEAVDESEFDESPRRKRFRKAVLFAGA